MDSRELEQRYRDWPSLVAMFFDQAERLGDRALLWQKRGGSYTPMTWFEVARQIRAVAAGLQALGVARGDRVVLVGDNSPEWFIADFGIMAAGAITVPAYTTNTVNDHIHLLSDSGAKAAIVARQRLFDQLAPAVPYGPNMAFVATISDVQADKAGDLPVYSWSGLQEAGNGAEDVAEAQRAQLTRDDTACIIYTSGTSGRPKGVMQTHKGIFANMAGAYRLLKELGLDDERFLSFLPLSHSYEHTAGQMWPVSLGAQIYYAEGIESLSTNLQEVRPTILIAVPRLFETMHNRINRQVQRQGGRSAQLFAQAEALGRKRYERGGLNPIDALKDKVLDKLVRDKVRQRFGGKLKAMVSGGAPLNTEVGLFFHALGVMVLQGYGQTEASPVVSCNRPSRIRMHTVGPPLPGVEVSICNDGEVAVAGDLVMPGYWNNPEASRDTVKNGWLYTGDVGHLDSEGMLNITDRKKDIIVNSGGDNISPALVEGELERQPEIAQAAVFGDKKPYLVALLVPDPEWAESWAKTNDRPADFESLAADKDFRKALDAGLQRANGGLAQSHRVRRFAILTQAFSLDTGEMTPTLKLKRHVVRKNYQGEIDRLYKS